MLEMLKLFLDGAILRDGASKGMLTWRVTLSAVVFVVILYGTAVPAVVLYQNHPQYKPLFIAALVFDAVLFVAYMTWAVRWYMRQLVRQRNQNSAE
jgi:hypothetical protein